MVLFDYRESKPVYKRIEDSLIKLIEQNAFLPGEYLPSIQEIASRNAVNPMAVRTALDSLVENKYIGTDNRGYYILDKNGNKQDSELDKFDYLVENLLKEQVSEEKLIQRIREIKGKEL